MTPEEHAQLVEELERDIERLQALYNQYFMGIEKLEPTIQRKSVERKIQLLRRERLRNTVLRFRFQTQLQKFNTQTTYWRRICRQIEEGTYERHVQRAKQRTAFRTRATSAAEPESRGEGGWGEDGVEEAAPAFEIDLEGFELDEPFTRLTRDPVPAAPLAPESSDPLGGLDDPFDDTFQQGRLGTDDVTGLPKIERVAAPATTGLEQSRSSRVMLPKEDQELSSFFKPRITPPPPPGGPGQIRISPRKPNRKDETTRRNPLPSPEPPPTSAPQTHRAEPSPPSPAREPAHSAESEPFDEKRAQAIYRTYVAARKKTQEPTENITYEKVASSLRKQWETKGGEVDFKVVIRGGKAVIKSVKKEE